MLIVIGVIVFLTGILALTFRGALTRLAASLLIANSIDPDESGKSKIRRVYVLGGSFMMVAGFFTVVYALTLGASSL